MNESLFSIIQGLKPEDLTTEVLRIVLDKVNDYELYRRYFFREILKIPDILTQSYLITTQSVYTDNDTVSRPDIQIESEDHFILIENKLTANFTKDQLKRYFEIALRCDAIKKYLFLLCPRYKKTHYLSEIKRQLGTDTIEENFKYKNVVIFRIILWDDIVKVFKPGKYLTDSLCKYITEHYLSDLIMKDKEMEVMNSALIPDIMKKLTETINQSRQVLQDEGFQTSNLTTSTTASYYIVTLGNIEVFVQYDLNLWKKYETPFVLQIFNQPELAKLLDSNTSIEYHEESKSYCFPILIHENDIFQIFLDKVRAFLNQLR